MFSGASHLLIILHLSLPARAELLPWDGFLAQMQQEDLAFEDTSTTPPRTVKNHIYKSKKIESTAIVFMPGMGEPVLKYYELANDLASLPATLYFWDHIGQGSSTHLLADELGKTHIESFKLHVETLRKFLHSLKSQHRRVFIVSHSMGAHIALRVMQESPGAVDKIVTTAPMIDIRRYYLPLSMLKWLLSFKTSTDYMWGASAKKTGATPFLTHSEKRQDEYQKLLKTYPDLQRRWVTIRWMLAALDSIEILGNQRSPAIETPILMIQADTELLVSPSAQESFCARQKMCTLRKIEGTYHEIFVEKDPARREAIELTKKFLMD